MARNRKREANGTAWYRKFDDGWYTTIDGKRTRVRCATARTIKGKDMKADAELAIARLKLSIPATHSRGHYSRCQRGRCIPSASEGVCNR
jgi:hypothetical protein